VPQPTKQPITPDVLRDTVIILQLLANAVYQEARLDQNLRHGRHCSSGDSAKERENPVEITGAVIPL
jgi:hypothetical protein